ncbi:lipid asymmetry maintenance protein MlaB [Dokdonella sp.]|uniref:STAS domain-containing protein n=1 Tax=Dokdonella sp. TaxID=2291710 RepID=UPI003527D1BB
MSAGFSLESAGPGRARISGRIDVENAAEVFELGLLLSGDGPGMEVDVSALTTADSVTLAVLIAWAGRARKQGKGVHYSGISDQLRALARLSDVESLLDAAPTPSG